MNLQKQLRCVYLHAFFSTLRFYRCRLGGAAGGAGLLAGGNRPGRRVFHLTSLLCEVPSGMAADLLGRRRALIFGGVLGVFSALAMASAPGLGLILHGHGAEGAGLQYAFRHGRSPDLRQPENGRAGERLYKSRRQCVDLHEKLQRRSARWQSLLAGVLRYAGYYLADAVSALLSALAAARLEEPIVTDEQAARSGTPCRNCPPGCVCMFLDSADCLRGSALARRLIAADAVISLPKLLDVDVCAAAADGTGQGHGMAVPAGAAGRGCRYGGHGTGAAAAPQDPARPVFSLCADHRRGGTAGRGGPGVGLCRRADAGAGALAVWFLHSMQRMNESISSDRRATLISVDSMTYSLLMIPASPMLGWLGMLPGPQGSGCVCWVQWWQPAVFAVAAKTRYNTRGA